MQAVVSGLVVDELGLCTSTTLEQRGRLPELSRRYFVRAAGEYRSAQPASIPLDIDHERIVGSVAYLERQEGAGVRAVAVVDDVGDLAKLGGERLYFSPDTVAHGLDGVRGLDITLEALALTTRPGTNAARPVRLIAGDLENVARRTRQELGHEHDLIKRAAAHRGGTAQIVERRTAVDDPYRHRPSWMVDHEHRDADGVLLDPTRVTWELERNGETIYVGRRGGAILSVR